MSGLLLAGDVYIDRLTAAGEQQGLIGPINVTSLALNTPSETKDRISKSKASYGQAVDSVAIAQPTEVSIAIDDQPADILALALLGDVAEINQASGSVSDVASVIPEGNKWVQLPKTNLGESITVKLASDNSTVSPAAYEINYALGLIRSVPEGALDTGTATSVLVSYDHNAISGNRVSGAVRSDIKVRVLLDGQNLVNGKAVRLDIPQAVLSPTEAVDLLSDEYVSTTLSGKVLLISGETAPFYIDQDD
ncbi:MAG: hypothetical protein ACPGPF_00075 [Pontibacterium sp.]